jgi:hypothetical protein
LKTIQKAKLRADYSNLNKFRVRLATKKEASLAKLPPCEATFHQHVLRSSLHTYIWKSSQKAQFPVRSPLMFGWEDKGGLVPVLFRGNDRTTSLSNYKMTIVDLSRHYMADNFVHNNKAL